MKPNRQSFWVVFLLLTAAVAAVAETGMDAARLKLIRVRMQEFVNQNKTAGTVTLIQRHGEVASLEAVGYQDLESRTPMRADTIFQIMSMTKPVVCVGVMILMEEGRLSLLDPVKKYLPEFEWQLMRVTGRDDRSVTLVPPPRPVNIRDLMTHTSGMSGHLPKSLKDLYKTFDTTLADAVRAFAEQPLDFAPGTKWQYSNTGIATLGRIIEVVSGEPFEKFIRTRIFEPLGMKDSFFFLPKDRHGRLASLYTYTGGKLVKSKADIFRTGSIYPMPAGGMYSTAADMAAFHQMMLNGGSYHGKRILSPAAVKLMTMVHTGNLRTAFSPGLGYGLGWSVVREPLGMFRLNSMGTFAKGGAFRTYGWVDPGKDLVGILMMQRTNGNGDMAEELNALMAIANSAITK